LSLFIPVGLGRVSNSSGSSIGKAGFSERYATSEGWETDMEANHPSCPLHLLAFFENLRLEIGLAGLIREAPSVQTTVVTAGMCHDAA
jgi:hypothetical protein